MTGDSRHATIGNVAPICRQGIGVYESFRHKVWSFDSIARICLPEHLSVGKHAVVAAHALRVHGIVVKRSRALKLHFELALRQVKFLYLVEGVLYQQLGIPIFVKIRVNPYTVGKRWGLAKFFQSNSKLPKRCRV